MLFYEPDTNQYYDVDDKSINDYLDERIKRNLSIEKHYLTVNECYEMAMGKTLKEANEEEYSYLLDLTIKKPELFEEGSFLKKRLDDLMIWHFIDGE